MTKKKLLTIVLSSVGVLMVAALTGGVIYKMQKTQEVEEYLAQQRQQAQVEQAALSAQSEDMSLIPLSVGQEKISEEDPAQEETNTNETIQEQPTGTEQQEAASSASDVTASQGSGSSSAAKEPEPVSSAPEVNVSQDENGNQVISPDWEKPAPPSEEELHNPEQPPETPERQDPTTDDGMNFDENGNQVPNENGEIFVPGFGWQKPTGGYTEHINVELSGNLIGY